MIQDIYPHEYNNLYINCSPDDDSRIMFVDGLKVLADENDFPLFSDVKSFKCNYRYLFAIDDMKFFLAYDYEGQPEGNYDYVGIRSFYKYDKKYMAFAAITAYQIKNWYENNRYCGRCREEREHSDRERMLKCPKCRHTLYPNIAPAVIVGVIDGDRILMTKYANREYTRYALIAGFTEVGETLEETVKREVMEEVGLKVKNCKYYKCQPWSFSDSLLVGFFCQLDGSDKVKLDEEELSVAEWINREDMDTVLDGISLTNEMMMQFKENKVSFD